MKKTFAVFLQVAIIALGLGALAFLLWEPWIEGRNAHATFFQVYFNDPFLVYAYTASIAFFVALYQAFTLAGYMGEGNTYSTQSVHAWHTIRRCALILIAFIAAAEACLFIVRPEDDIAGGVAIGVALIILSAIAATLAHVFERKVQRTMDAESENNASIAA